MAITDYFNSDANQRFTDRVNSAKFNPTGIPNDSSTGDALRNQAPRPPADPRLTAQAPQLDRSKLVQSNSLPDTVRARLTPTPQPTVNAGNIPPATPSPTPAPATAQAIPRPSAIPNANVIPKTIATPTGNIVNPALDPLQRPVNNPFSGINVGGKISKAFDLVNKFASSNYGKGLAIAGGAIQAGKGAYDIATDTSSLTLANAPRKIDNVINTTLGAGTVAAPQAVAAPNLGYQAGKFGGGLIATAADKLGLLNSFKPVEQAQTPAFLSAQAKMATGAKPSSAQPVTQPAVTPAGATVTPDNKTAFESFTEAERQAMIRDSQKDGKNSFGVDFTKPDGKVLHNDIVTTNNAGSGSGAISNYGKSRNSPQNTNAQPSAQTVRQLVEQTQPQQALPELIDPSSQFTPEELANTPKFSLAVNSASGGSVNGKPNMQQFVYPDGRVVELPLNAKIDESTLAGSSRMNTIQNYQKQLQARQPINTATLFDGQVVNNPVNVINGLTDSIEGFNDRGAPISGYASKKIVQRDEKGNALADAQGNPVYVDNFLQTPQLSDQEKVQTLKGETDITTTGMTNASAEKRTGMQEDGANSRYDKSGQELNEMQVKNQRDLMSDDPNVVAKAEKQYEKLNRGKPKDNFVKIDGGSGVDPDTGMVTKNPDILVNASNGLPVNLNSQPSKVASPLGKPSTKGGKPVADGTSMTVNNQKYVSSGGVWTLGK